MYKQYETISEIFSSVAEVLRACEYAGIKTNTVHESATGGLSTTLRIYLDVDGHDYLIEYFQGVLYPVIRLDAKKVSLKQLLNELNKLTQVIEEYEEAVQ